MRMAGLSAWVFAFIVILAGAPDLWVSRAAAQAATSQAAAGQGNEAMRDNELCLGCHSIEGFATTGPDGKERNLHVRAEEFSASVHGKRFSCVDCHKDITEIPHQPGIEIKVGCIQCHRSLWDTARQQNKTEEFARLGVVVQKIESYMHSVHARPSMADQSRTNATCYDCHNAHYVTPIDSSIGAEGRLKIPQTCGRCHTKQLADYATSVHGLAVANSNSYAAVCTDCHTTHEIESPEGASIRVGITRNCGNCHEKALETYLGTYHGQVSTLGYAYTAKCFDCHGSHTIQWVGSEASLVSPKNRIQTCQKCHKNATAGFATFQPHGNTGDFEKYPYLWIAGKGMGGLLIGVFAFFWTHSALWFYREYQDRKHGRNQPHVEIDKLPPGAKRYFRRWPAAWRLVHLIFALAIMTLVLTGTAVLYGESAWARGVINLLGGPRTAAIVHRVAAATFMTLFFGHLVYVAYYLVRNWKTFRFFGPNSTVPNLQDLWDVIAMFKWFFGTAPRPVFDHWTYWKKFDYWAPFWGMVIIGFSGLMLWFPEKTASVLPGWVFNIATLIHGEEAFLAAVFLFSVHFFNVHFRPDKFPMDILMFTGAMPLEEFQREHTLEYRRLLESGELEKYLVDAPSRPMTVASKILGTVLILIGLTLLVLVLIGFVEQLVSA